jgi:outer membrane protein OmpA-like peptidoglycan-associated protein
MNSWEAENMNTITNTRKSLLLVSAVTAAFVSACASNAPKPSLEGARMVVNQAANNPEVARRAPLELKAARDTIDQADGVWRNDRDEGEVNHLAYLATQRAEVAKNLARSRQTDEDVKDANNAGDKLRLEARTREAERARMDATAAQGQTLTAQALARQSQIDAANAQQTAATAEQNAVAATRMAAADRAQSIVAQESAAAQRQRAEQAADTANAAQERVRQLEAQLKDIEGKQTERGLLVTLGDVLFAFNKSELTAQAAPRLDKLAAFLRQFPQRKLLVEGYTDAIGGDAYNMDLSERRAEAIREALVARGVDTARVVTKGYGKAYPVADNASTDGRAVNRRVEVVIADENGNLKGRGA